MLATELSESEATRLRVEIYRRFGLRRSRAGRTTCDVLTILSVIREPQRRSAPNRSGDKSHALHEPATALTTRTLLELLSKHGEVFAYAL